MRVAPHPSEIRALVVRTLEDLSTPQHALQNLRETIVLDSGKYRARSYRVEGFMAMWLVDVGIVQFYDAEGNMLRTINLFHEREPLRIAA